MDLRPEVRQFLLRNFDSAAALDIVALLGRSPETFWTAQAAARHLGLREEVAASNLSVLSARRILVRGGETGAYRFAPAEAMRELAGELLRLYSGDREGLIRAIESGRLHSRRPDDEERPNHE